MGLENPQDKLSFCHYGNIAEYVFCGLYFEKLGVIINPAKTYNKDEGKYMPDLFNIKSSRIGDLKTVNAPFFKAKEYYNLNPQYAISFNEKDRIKYKAKYDYIDIYFWIRFNKKTIIQANRFGVVLKEVHSVYAIGFRQLDKLLDKAPIHEYKDRKDDTNGNAKKSYIIEYNKLYKIA